MQRMGYVLCTLAKLGSINGGTEGFFLLDTTIVNMYIFITWAHVTRICFNDIYDTFTIEDKPLCGTSTKLEQSKRR